MNAAVVANHIQVDDRGVAWVDNTRVKVIEVAMDWIAHRNTPEEMHVQFPHLSVAQIHAALSFYYDQKADFDKAIAESLSASEKLAVETANSPLHRRLRSQGLIQ